MIFGNLLEALEDDNTHYIVKESKSTYQKKNNAINSTYYLLFNLPIYSKIIP